jgi:hypothetical protein
LRQLIDEDTSKTYPIQCNDEFIIFHEYDLDDEFIEKFDYLHQNCNNLPTSYLVLSF